MEQKNQWLHLQSAGTALPAPGSGSRSCCERGKPAWLFASGSPRARTGVPSPGDRGDSGLGRGRSWESSACQKKGHGRDKRETEGNQPRKKHLHLAAPAQASRPRSKSHKLFLQCRDGESSCPQPPPQQQGCEFSLEPGKGRAHEAKGVGAPGSGSFGQERGQGRS